MRYNETGESLVGYQWVSPDKLTYGDCVFWQGKDTIIMKIVKTEAAGTRPIIQVFTSLGTFEAEGGVLVKKP